MRTQELIVELTADLRPVHRNALTRQLTGGLAAGTGLALLLLLFGFGLRDDLRTALLTVPFWTKWVFALAIAIPAFLLSKRLAQPGREPGRLPLVLIAPVVMLAVLAVHDLLSTPPEGRAAVWLGHSAPWCSPAIGLLSIPALGLTLWILRRCAPIRLRLAGFAAGLLSGAAAALVYVLHCTESEPAFAVTWYTIGMLLPAAAGAIVGPRLLRW